MFNTIETPHSSSPYRLTSKTIQTLPNNRLSVAMNIPTTLSQLQLKKPYFVKQNFTNLSSLAKNLKKQNKNLFPNQSTNSTPKKTPEK